MIEWLSTEKYEGDIVVDLSKAKAAYEVVEIVPGMGWIAWNKGDDLWFKFAVLEFRHSDVDDTNIFCQLIFHGEGPSGNLRECRHTYWGEEGYIFYPKNKVIVAALGALEEFYDMD